MLVAGGQLDQQPRLAHPGRAGECHEPHIRVGDEPAQRLQFVLATDQPGDRSRQVRRCHRGGSRSRIARGLGRGRRQEQWVALENPLVELDQRRARVESELVGEEATSSLVGLERVRLAAGAIQRQHQLPPDSLLERMLRGQALDFRHQLSRPAVREVGVDPLDDRLHALLLECSSPMPDGPLGGHVGQWVTAKERERLAQQGWSTLRIGPRLVDELVEPPGVDLECARHQRIAGGVEDDETAQQRAQLGQMHVQGRHGARRGPITPQLVDQPVAGERHAAGLEQQRQQRSLAPAGHRHRSSIALERERTKDPETSDAAGPHRDKG